MSARKLPVNFSPEAWDDLEDIAIYSALTWSEERKDQYLGTLERALLRLGDFPQLGRARHDLRPGYRSLQIERHIAIDEALPTELYILSILHVRMDARRVLTQAFSARCATGLPRLARSRRWRHDHDGVHVTARVLVHQRTYQVTTTVIRVT